MSKSNRKKDKGSKGKNKSSKNQGIPKGVVTAMVVLIIGGFVAFITEPLWSTSSMSHDDPAMIAMGKTLFAKNCQACHGDNAQGQDPLQAKGGQRADGSYIAPALNGTAHSWHHPTAALFKLIKDGSPAKDSPMRSWSDKMSDEEIHATIAFFRSLWPEPIKKRSASMGM